MVCRWLREALVPMRAAFTHQWPKSLGTGPLASEGLQDADATRPGGYIGARLPNELELGKYLLGGRSYSTWLGPAAASCLDDNSIDTEPRENEDPEQKDW